MSITPSTSNAEYQYRPYAHTFYVPNEKKIGERNLLSCLIMAGSRLENVMKRHHHEMGVESYRPVLEYWLLRELKDNHRNFPPFELSHLRDETGIGIIGDWLIDEGSSWQYLLLELRQEYESKRIMS